MFFGPGTLEMIRLNGGRVMPCMRSIGASHADPAAVEASRQVGEVVRISAMSWGAARLVATQALQEGRDHVDIAIAVADADELPVRIQVLRRAVNAAEAMAEQGLLITMPAPPDVQRWRDWVEAEMIEQVLSGRSPVSFRDFRAG